MVVAPSNVGPRTRSWRNEILGEDSNRSAISKSDTELFPAPMKINMKPKNGGLEDDFPFQLGNF